MDMFLIFNKRLSISTGVVFIVEEIVGQSQVIE